MSRYDEDLYENPFFVTLEKKYSKLFEEATVKRWIICIPQFCMVTKDDLQDADFKDHILVPSSDDTFHTVSKHEVIIKQQIIELGKGFVKRKKVEILFEETFYNNNDESYRVLCVSEFFNREPEASLSGETAASGGVLVKQPVTYEDYMKLLWTNTSSKTKDHLDKLLNTFCSSYEKFENERISSLADFVSAQLTRAMQVVLKDPSVKRSVKHSDSVMVKLKVAVEMYMMNTTHQKLFSTITASVKSSDAEVNKMTRNLKHIRLKQLGVRKEFEENLPQAKVELAKLNKFSTPLGRLFCLKKVVAALTRPLKKATESQDVLMTTDDFLPLLIYLIIKSEIPNWTANLMYMKHFHQSKVFEDDEFSFYLATTEAALDYLCSGKVKMENTEPVQKRPRPRDSEENPSFKRQGSGGASSAKEKFFQYVQYGDEAAVTLMLRSHSSGYTDVMSRLCHPLCTCDRCSDLLSKNKHSTDVVSPYSRDDMGHTALHIASMYGQAKLIDILIQHGSLPDSTDYLGCTPLHLAAQKGFQNIILLLVHFGSDISAVDNEGNTPLHMCAMNGHEDCVKAILFLDILKNRLNVNAKNDMGNTPLHLASKWGYEGIVRFLLDTEADPRIRNRKRQTPLNLAQNSVIKRELQMAFDILPPIVITHKEDQNLTHPKPPPQPPPSPHMSPDITTNKTDSSDAQTDKKPEGFEVVDVHPVIKPPLAMVDSSGGSLSTPEVASLDTYAWREVERLFKAIKDKDLPLVKYYLNWTDTDPESPDSPSLEGSLCHPLCQCAKCQSLLKKSGGGSLNVNCQNKKGFAPLHIAIIEKNTEAFQLFLRKGAKVNLQTNKLITPLHLACFHYNLDVVKTLIEAGAGVNIKDLHGEIALHLAAAKKCAEITKLLIQNSSLVNLANRDGNTPLHHACNVESLDVARILLDSGAEVDVINKNNELPADLAKSEEIKQLLASYSRPLRKSKSLDAKDLEIGKSRDSDMTTRPSEKSKVNVKELFAALEEKDLSTLEQITRSIKSFDKEKSLKRSRTFDKSALTLDLIKIPMSIQHFDHSSLRHVDSVDKSSPMHIYSLLRSESTYTNYVETPSITSEHLERIPGSSDVDESSKIGDSDVPIKQSLEKENLDENTGTSDDANMSEDYKLLEIDLEKSEAAKHKELGEIQKFQEVKCENAENLATGSDQSLLDGTYVLVEETCEKKVITEDDKTVEMTGKLKNFFSGANDTQVEECSSEAQVVDKKLDINSSVSLLLADYDNLNINAGKLLENDFGIQENEKNMSLCSELSLADDVNHTHQSENQESEKAVKNELNTYKTTDSSSSTEKESAEQVHIDTTNFLVSLTDIHEGDKHSEESDRQFSVEGFHQNQNIRTDNISKIIDDALTDDGFTIHRPQYGLASVPAGLTVGGMPAGLAPIPAGMSGMPAGMTALQTGGMPAGMAGVPTGMQAMYATDKTAGLYSSGSTAYRLPQGSYLAQPGSAQGYLTASQPPGYLAVSSPMGQPRYMTVSQAYPSSTIGSSQSVYTGSPGYSLSAGYYSPSVTSALSVQPVPSSLSESSRLSTTSSPPAPTQSQYPTYIGTQLGPMQISPSQNPYAAAATGHPLYPSPLTSLQVQTQQTTMTGLPGQIPTRVAPLGTATAYQSMAYPAHATSPTIPGASFYPSY